MPAEPARFDRVIIADWSASNAPSPARPSPDAIWLGTCDETGVFTQYHRTRRSAEAALTRAIAAAVGQNQRLLIGFDFPMGYPAGFAQRLTGQPTAQSVWAWLATHITDTADNRNNRFEVAAAINRQIGLCAGAEGPFWGRPAQRQIADLPMRKTADYGMLGFAQRREVEILIPRAQPVWKLYTTGAAGSQGLMGQPMINRLSLMPHTGVWPFHGIDATVLLAEVYPSLLAAAVAADPAPVKDEAQVRLLARALFRLSQQAGLAPFFATPPAPVTTEEGWILGAGQTGALYRVLE